MWVDWRQGIDLLDHRQEGLKGGVTGAWRAVGVGVKEVGRIWSRGAQAQSGTLCRMPTCTQLRTHQVAAWLACELTLQGTLSVPHRHVRLA